MSWVMEAVRSHALLTSHASMASLSRLCSPPPCSIGPPPCFRQSLARADASLVSPLLTFNPAFTLLLAWPTLHEVPGLRQSTGVAVMLLGAYLLDVEEARTELLACSSKVCSRWALILRMPR